MKKYLNLIGLYYVLMPLIISFIGFLLSMSFEKFGLIMLFVFLAAGVLAGTLYGRRSEQTVSFNRRYLPIYIPVFLTVTSAAVLMIISKGFFGHSLWSVFTFLEFPFLLNTFLSAMTGDFINIFLAPFLYFVGFLLGYLFTERRRSERSEFNLKSLIAAAAVVVLCLSVGTGVMWKRSQTILPVSYGFEYGNGFSDVDLEPYSVTNPNNILPKINEQPSLLIEKTDMMPVLDGAEAAYPVYAAFAHTVYRNIDKNNNNPDGSEIVGFTNTIFAFERLISGEVDIFFGAQPSEEQEKMAADAGKELVLTPIGKEAFVFFVNKRNTVSDLSADKIKGIYSGKITNWKNAGGESSSIRAFQRPQNSGSQTIMQKIMGKTPLMNPLKEEVAGMGKIMEEVAAYRNYKNAIGYSFRFFTTGMNPNNELKLLSVNGFEPSPENITNGKYPYVVNLYAITLKDNPKKTIQPMLEWMQGQQGQKLVEEIGYLPLDGL